MSLEVLKELVEQTGDTKYQEAFTAVSQTLEDNVGRLTTLEKDATKAFQKRDSLTSLIRTTLGIEEVTEENIKSALESKKSTPDADVEKLTKLLEEAKVNEDTLKGQLQKTKHSYILEKELASLGAQSDVEGKRAYDLLVQEIWERNPVFDDDGQVKFVDKDGATLRKNDGTPFGLSDVYSTLRESEDTAFLFKAKRKPSGSGATGGNPPSAQASLTRAKMTHAEKAAYISKHGQDAYLKLPN